MSSRGSLGELHINVVAAGADAHMQSLWPEIRMVKAALLYADSVTLTSPKLTVLRYFAGVAPQDPERRRAIEESGITEKPGWQAAISILHGMRLGHQPTAEELGWLERFSDELALYDRLHREQTGRTLAAAGGEELQLGVNSGVVRLQPIPGDVTNPQTYADEVLDTFEDAFRDALDAERPTYPLFDFMAWLTLRPTVEAAGVTPAEMAPANEVALAARMIVDRVEAFPDATMDVVLDVRDRLEGPLVRFRAALAKAAAELDTTGFDDKFEREAQSLYRREVEPALQELRESLSDLGAHATLRRGAEPGVAALGLAAAGVVSFSALIAASAAWLGIAGKEELKYRRGVQQTKRENNYFFIWEADRLLRSERGGASGKSPA